MELGRIVKDLKAAQEALAGLNKDELVSLLLEWARRWQDPEREIGEDSLKRLCASTGWPRGHALAALRRAFEPWSKTTLDRLVCRVSKARIWLLAILAGRIPALATSAVFRALAARVPVILKPSSVEPVFCELLARSAQRHLDFLGQAVRFVTEPAIVRALVNEAPVCLAYGRDETVEAVRLARLGRPTFLGGHRESLVVVFKDALEFRHLSRLCRAVAEDCAIYDQSGCLSPHAVLVEDGGEVEPKEFAQGLWEALNKTLSRLPPSEPPLKVAAVLRLFAEESRLLAAQQGGLVLPERGPVHPLVCLMPQGVFRPGPGYRVIQVLTFTGEPDFRRQVPSLGGRLQGMAVAGDRRRLDWPLQAAPEYRAPYLCRPGQLQRPPGYWLENGLDLTAELARLE